MTRNYWRVKLTTMGLTVDHCFPSVVVVRCPCTRSTPTPLGMLGVKRGIHYPT